jgi:hypothetical protein
MSVIFRANISYLAARTVGNFYEQAFFLSLPHQNPALLVGAT